MADQPLNPNYKYGQVTASLASKTGAQKRFLKSSALTQAVQSRLPYIFTLRGITVTVVSAIIVNGDVLQFVVSATRTGQNLSINNPLLFVNPPIMSPDGTTYTDGTGTHPVMAEQPLEAAKQMITQVIELQNP